MNDMNEQLPQGTAEQPQANPGEAFLFPEESHNRLKTAATSAGLGVLAVASAAGIYLAEKNGVSVHDILDSQYVPQPKVYPGIVDGFVATNNGLRTAAPVVAVAGLATQLGWYVAGKRSEHTRAVNQLATTDYAGTEGIMKTDTHPTMLDRMRRRSAAVGVGLIATFTAAMAGGMSGVEHEISNGPLRPVTRTFDMLSNGQANREIIVQSPGITFMDDSWLDRQKMVSLTQDAAKEGIYVVPFGKTLPNIDGRSGLMLTVPDQFVGDSPASCDMPPIILDEANSTPVGEPITINGTTFRVAKKIEGTAQMNRDIAIVGEDAAAHCIRGENPNDTPYFGAIVSGEQSQQQVDQLLADHGLDGEAVAVSEAHFDENNREFWRKNGTPLILQLIGCVGVLGGAAMMSLRRGKLLANAREIAVLRGQGVSPKDIKSAETRRAFRESAVSTIVAAPFMYGLAASFNAAEIGLKVGVGLREIAAGYTVTLLANIFGSRRSAKYLEKNLDVAGAVKKG